MPKSKDWVPKPDNEFFDFEDTLVAGVAAKIVPWNIDPLKFTPVQTEKGVYDPLYNKIRNKATRNSTDITNHRIERKVYEKLIRTFAKENLFYNSLMTDADRQSIGIPPRDTIASPRPAIDTEPSVKIKFMSGARAVFECRVEADQTRPSMHPDADEIEVVYQIGGTQPVDPESCPKTNLSKKARFTILAGIANAGKKFFCYVRWRNSSEPQKSSPWSLIIQGTISE